MTSTQPNPTLCISAPEDLSASHVGSFRENARLKIQPDHTRLDIDLADTKFVDSSGLGALVSLHKIMNARGGHVRLLRPTPGVLQLIELTRMHRIFEIVRAQA